LDRKLKVLQFVDGGAVYGGAVSVINTCEQMRTAGHAIEVLILTGRPLGPVLRERGFLVHEIDLRHKFDLPRIGALAQIFRQGNYDLVHTHLSLASLMGGLAGRRARVPVASHVHGMNLKYTYMFARHLIAVSMAGKANLVRQGVPPERVSVVYNGIDFPDPATLPRRDQVLASLGLPADALVLGTIARVHWAKGFRTVLAALPGLLGRYPRLHYVVAGKGKHYDEIRAAASALGFGERIVFLGIRHDVPALLRAFDGFVLPTLKEAMGISFVEAMAAGVPCVGTRVGGVPEVITPETGILVPPEDAAALAQACDTLLADPALRQSLGQAGVSRAKSIFSREASAQALERAYARTLAEEAMGKRRD
jgi:glycosyltransferase involved in cell wall biosynthesis